MPLDKIQKHMLDFKPATKEELDSTNEQLAQTEQEVSETKNNINYPAFNLKRKLKVDAKYGQKRINVLGDSISHGANAPDIPNDAWTGIMRKFLQYEYSTKNYGFVNFNSAISNSQGTYYDAIDITPSGTWTKAIYGGALGAYRYSSSELGAKLAINIKKECKRIQFHFERYASYDSAIAVKINGTQVMTFNTGGTDDTSMVTNTLDVSSYVFPLVVEVEKLDAVYTTLTGISLYDDINDIVFNNYSRSGLKLVDLTDSILTNICDSNILFFALGHNDRYGGGSLTTFINKINLIRDTINANEAFLIVMDFLWYEPASESFRKEIKRLSDEVPNSVYIPYPDYLWDSTQSTKWIAEGFLSDSSHPSVMGHQMIAESAAKKMQLGITSKRVIADLKQPDGEWNYVSVFTNGWTNLFSSKKYLTKYKKVNGVVHVEIYVKDGTIDLSAFTLPVGFRPSASSTFILDIPTSSTYRKVVVRENGEVLIKADSAVANLQGTFSFITTQ